MQVRILMIIMYDVIMNMKKDVTNAGKNTDDYDV